MVELVDITPTLLEIAGIEQPAFMQGKSLLPILMGKAEPNKHKEHVYCEFYNALLGVHQHVYGTMFFDGRYKLVVYHGDDCGELYDLQTDPDEFINLWDVTEVQPLKAKLMKMSFDASVLMLDPNPPFVSRW